MAIVMWAMWPTMAQEELYGDIDCHDPSTLVKDGNGYYFFGTGAGVPFYYSTDLRNWTHAASDRVFPGGPPAWVTNAVQDYDPGNWSWAPDVAYFNGKYHVYYSVSEWGSIDSVIGLVTSPSLTAPVWTDRGRVAQSDADWEPAPETDTTEYNCIDPSILVDTNGSVWMTFGSYSSGILVTELDPSTGLRMNTNTLDVTQVANNAPGGAWGSSIEAAFTYQHAGDYYLFVNYGGCCSGTYSTYNIRVGRSSSVTGPYLDKDGVDMNNGGGTVLLESCGRFVGPGHAGILNDNGTEWFSYHYYTWPEFGAWSQLGLSRLSWDEDDWPVLSNDWSALYTFNTDAREHMNWYDGALTNGGAVVADERLGNALELDGSGHVKLHDAVANCSTVAAWVKWDGGTNNTWQRIFDFGTDTNAYMFLTPRSYFGEMRFGITTSGNLNEEIIDAPFALPTNTWCHVAVTLDGEQGIIYFNGEAVASNSITIRPWEIQAQNNYIGKSQWPDPGFEGCIASFRVFADALSADEIREIAYTHPALAHRYSFTSNANDSVGMAHGQLKGSAVITNNVLSLPGSIGSYAQLPGGLVSGCGALTIEFWADIGVNGNWARIFDFGDYWNDGVNDWGSNFLYLSPAINASQYRMDMNGTLFDVSGGTLNNQSVHVVCIVDPGSSYMAIYVNGTLIKQQTGATSALSSISRAWSFIGRSLFSADPYLDADIDEFRIYDGRLSPEQIVANYAAGPDVVYQPIALSWSHNASSITFDWPSYPAGYALEYSTTLKPETVWTLLAQPFPEDGKYSQALNMDSVSASNAFFRLRR